MTEPIKHSAKRRVLFVSHEATLSGAPVQLLHLLPILNRQGWETVFATPESGPIVDLLQEAGVRVELDDKFLVEPEHEKLRTLCREFDLVVANTITSWPAVEAAHLENVPAVWYIHETLVAAQFMKRIWQIGKMLNVARVIVVPTRRTAGILQGATRTRIETIPYGIPDLAAPAKLERDGPISFVTLGSFEPRKGQDILVDAIGDLTTAMYDKVSFKFAGRALDRPFFDEVNRRANELKNVTLIPSLNHQEALDLLRSSDGLICPSRDETMPITIIEAAALGKAIISTDVGGIGEWIHDGLNGLLVPAENSAALSDAIARCARDRRLLDRLGSAARRTYERHFTLDRFANEFADLLAGVAQPNCTATRFGAAQLRALDGGL